MYRAFRIVLMVLGGLFVVQLGVITYVVIADPFNLRPLVQLVWQSSAKPETVSTTSVAAEQILPVSNTATSSHEVTKPNTVPSLSKSVPPPAASTTGITSAQKAALQSVGIDSASFTAGISPVQLNCFTGILGTARVAEIKAGGVPSASEFLSVRSCL